MNTIPLEYPRPQLYRKAWHSLDGVWDFAFDDDDAGRRERWHVKPLGGKINVPFCHQCEKSGVADKGYHPVMWYSRCFDNSSEYGGKRVLLHFQAVDESFDVWINGEHAGVHHGGHTAACFEITPFLHEGENRISLRVEDRRAPHKPQGKQTPTGIVDRCWYTPTSGIWQSVWLEAVEKSYISSVHFRPDIDRDTVHIRAHCVCGEHDRLNIKISYKGTVVAEVSAAAKAETELSVCLGELDFTDEIQLWSPETPNLFDAELTLTSDFGEDRVISYFGMRKIEARNSKIYLNSKPYYLRMVLDQGYWRDSLMTPPEAGSLKADVELTRAFGFNGARKHQKLEDARYYYWADRLGLLVWAEMPSAYHFCAEQCAEMAHAWSEAIAQLYNHPSIIAWVPFNESWGIRKVLTDRCQQSLAEAMYHYIKAQDSTRLVSTNDGWEQVKSDICGIHDYFCTAEDFESKYRNIQALLADSAQGRRIYADGCRYGGEPIIISEYGGIALGEGTPEAWGYNEQAENAHAFCTRIESITRAICAHSDLAGFCYTQLTDVMQEINGLADADHVPKVPPETVSRIMRA